METNSIFVKNNATSRKKLWNLWQETTSNCRGLKKMETISTEHNRTIWNLDRLQEPKILQRTSKIKWMIGQIVLKATGLQFHLMTYSGENKYKGRHFVKERSSKYKER